MIGLIFKKPGIALLGGLLAAGATMLLAPRSGRQTRRLVTEFSEDVGFQARRYLKRGKRKLIFAGLKLLL